MNIITKIANEVVHTKYPSLGEHRYSDYDTEVIVNTFLVVKEHLKNEVPKTEKGTELPPTTS